MRREKSIGTSDAFGSPKNRERATRRVRSTKSGFFDVILIATALGIVAPSIYLLCHSPVVDELIPVVQSIQARFHLFD